MNCAMPIAPAVLTLTGSNRLSCQIRRARKAGGRSLARAASISVAQTSGRAATSLAGWSADVIPLSTLDGTSAVPTSTSLAASRGATDEVDAKHVLQLFSPLLVAQGSVAAVKMIAAEAT